MASAADLLLLVIQAVVFVWDFLTYPIYQVSDFRHQWSLDIIVLLAVQALQRPWERRKAMNKIRAKVVRSSAEEIVYESPEVSCPTDRDLTRAKVKKGLLLLLLLLRISLVVPSCPANQVDTMEKAWSWAVRRYGPRPLLGTRDILAEEDEVQSNGKIFKKLELGDYRFEKILVIARATKCTHLSLRCKQRWLSYEEADEAATFFGKGMRALGLNPGEKVTDRCRDNTNFICSKRYRCNSKSNIVINDINNSSCNSCISRNIATTITIITASKVTC